MTDVLAKVIPIDGTRKRTPEEDFRVAHEADATRYIQSLLAHPAEASAFMVPRELCATPAQAIVFEAIAMTVMAGAGPTPAMMADCLRQKGHEPNVITQFLEPYAAKPSDLYDMAMRRTDSVRLRKCLEGLHRDTVVLDRAGWMRKLNAALSSCSAGSGSKRLSVKDLVIAANESLIAPKDVVSTGWPTLDENLRLRPGDMVVVGAKSGIGKTSVALTWCLHAAQTGHPTCLISLEDGKHVLGPRVVSQLTGIDQNVWQRYRVSKDDMLKMERIDLSLPFWIEHSKRDAETVIRVMRSAAYSGAKMVIVDYIQRVRIDSKTNGLQELNNTIESLKTIAEDSGVILVLTSQMRRVNEPKPKRGQEKELYVPTIEELKGTSELECGAQAVVLLWGERNGFIRGKIGKSKNSGLTDEIFELVRDPCTGAVTEMTSFASRNSNGEKMPKWGEE